MDLNEIKKSILTGEEYWELMNKGVGDITSYIFDLNRGNKHLRFFGCTHTNDPGHPMYQEIEKSFNEFKPDMVYVEGVKFGDGSKEAYISGMAEMSIEEAKRTAESFFVLKLAINAGVDFECPEPDYIDEYNFLLNKDFSKKDLLTYYVYRQISQFQRERKINKNLNVEEYIEDYVTRRFIKAGWDEVEVNAWEEEILNNLDLDNEALYANSTNPTPSPKREWTHLNEIAKACSRFRDEYIVERLAEGLKTHNRLFVVYGFTHAVVQEPALKALFETI
jgi:hypothetical protein